MATVEFLVLGPLEVRVDTIAVRIPGRKQRALLACLLLARGRPVTTAELVGSVYGAEANGGAVHSLHELVSQLRRILEAAGLENVILSGTASYGLNVDPSQLDAWAFENVLDEAYASADMGVRADLLQRALQLWRGPVLAGVELEAEARAERQRLEELRWAALADWIDQELGAGRQRRAIAELERATRLNPENERLRAQLMLALYRDGRQADALRVYQETRAMLAAELGLEPTQQLRELERRILNHDPGLVAADGSAPAPSGGKHRRRIALAAAVVVFAAAMTAVGIGALSAGQAKAVFADSMKGTDINTKFWDVETFGTGPTVVEEKAGVRLTIPAHAIPGDSSGTIKARLTSYCTLSGAFDVQVDYNLSVWPTANGAGIGMYAAYGDLVRKSGPSGEQYVGAVRRLDPPDGAPHKAISTRDSSGALRIIRSGNRMTELVHSGGRWRQVDTFPNPTPASVSVLLELWTNAQRFSHRQVEVQLTNFRVNSGFLECPTA